MVTDATVVLVHGAFHGAWCWSKVVDGLAAQGVATLAIDLPRFDPSCETSLGLKRDSEAVRGAVSNACKVLSSGVTPSIACDQTPPTSVVCQ